MIIENGGDQKYGRAAKHNRSQSLKGHTLKG